MFYKQDIGPELLGFHSITIISKNTQNEMFFVTTIEKTGVHPVPYSFFV